MLYSSNGQDISPPNWSLGVQFTGTALSAASIMVMQLTLTQRNGVRSPGGARGSEGNRQTSRAQTSRYARSTRVSRTQCLFVQLAGRRSLVPEILVQIQGRQRRRRARLRLRFRAADDPGRHRAAAHLRSCRNWQTGTLEVRVLAGSNPAERTLHACLVATVSIPPWYGGGRGSIPRAGSHADVASAACDRSVSG